MLRTFFKYRGLLSRFSSKPPTPPSNRPDKQTIQKLQKQMMQNLQSADPSSKPEGIKYTWVFGLALVGIIAGYSVSRYFETVDKSQSSLVTRTDTPTFGGNWKMYDLQKNIITDKDLLGKNYVMYFGFTRCPDVCPAFLFKLTTALKLISQHESSKMFTLLPVFVSLDPQYDTAQRIQTFLSHYHPSTLALTTPVHQRENLQNTMKQFNVYANRIPNGDSYSIDHSVIGYLMSEDGKFLCLLGPNLSSKEMASKIEEELTYVQTIKLKKFASYI